MRIYPSTADISVIDQSEPDFASPRHSHPQAQLIYAVSGVVEVTTEAGSWVVPPSRAVWVPAAMPHATRSHGPVEFRALLIGPAAPGAPGERPLTCMVVEVTPLLRELILKLARVSKSASHDPDLIEAIIKLLMMELQFLPVAALSLPMPKTPELLFLCERVRADLTSTVSIEAAVTQLGMSRASFMRHFKTETAMSFGRWQQQARLLKALALLAEGRSILNVALDCGYDSPSAFTAMFRRSLGKTPSDYFG
jgi:AraC-like DNA-binding protein